MAAAVEYVAGGVGADALLNSHTFSFYPPLTVSDPKGQPNYPNGCCSLPSDREPHDSQGATAVPDTRFRQTTGCRARTDSVAATSAGFDFSTWTKTCARVSVRLSRPRHEPLDDDKGAEL